MSTGVPRNGPRPSRRLVVGGAAVAALATVTASASAATGTAASYLTPDPLLHLLRRATFGPSPASIKEIRSLGAATWLDRQLAPASIPDTVCADLVQRLPLAALSIDGVRARMRSGRLREYSSDVMLQVGYAAMARAVWSDRQLFEVMVDFWSNHLNVTCPAGDVWDNRQDYDRAVIRQHALGRFADMLKASAQHPAMLTYLDNRYSTRTAPNENYARELLELHTVGLMFTEPDVKGAARLLSGLTVDPATGRYRYDPGAHATGRSTVLGFSRPNTTGAGGAAQAMAMLDYLAMLPATALRIARKLCVRFVSDDPPVSLVNRLARVYRENRTAIVPVLRALFTSAEFKASIGAKVRTPLEDIAATVRILGFRPEPWATGTSGLEGLYWIADSAGQAPLAWAPPNGYPDVAAAWASPSGQLIRWNAHLNIAGGWWPHQITRPPNLLRDLVGPLPATYGGLVDAVAKRLFGRVLRGEHRAALTAFFDRTPASPLRSWDGAAGWSFPHLVALMLNSPYFAVR